MDKELFDKWLAHMCEHNDMSEVTLAKAKEMFKESCYGIFDNHESMIKNIASLQEETAKSLPHDPCFGDPTPEANGYLSWDDYAQSLFDEKAIFVIETDKGQLAAFKWGGLPV